MSGGTTASSCCRYGRRSRCEPWAVAHPEAGLLTGAELLAWTTVIDWTVCDLVSQRGQTARRHQLRARYGRAQGQRPGQPKRGECGDLRCLLPARVHKPLTRLARCASSCCCCCLSLSCWCLQTFVNDVRIQEQSYVTLKIEDKLRFGYDIL